MTLYEIIKHCQVVRTNAYDMYAPDYIRESSDEDLNREVTVMGNKVYRLNEQMIPESQWWLIVDPEDEKKVNMMTKNEALQKLDKVIGYEHPLMYHTREAAVAVLKAAEAIPYGSDGNSPYWRLTNWQDSDTNVYLNVYHNYNQTIWFVKDISPEDGSGW